MTSTDIDTRTEAGSAQEHPPVREMHETTHGMRIIWDAPVPMSDGTILRADVFLPEQPGRYPAILSHGCYGKGILFQEGYPNQWNQMVSDFPEILEGSSGDFQAWELADPERFVPHGYAVVRVDSRGSGNSEGVRHLWGHQEALDYAEAIDWAGEQEWCDGSVGLLGISYYAAYQWQVAALQPKHLKAIVPWEGTSDLYREFYHHGGIPSAFLQSWSDKQVRSQYGYGERGLRNAHTGATTAGPTLSEEELREGRVDIVADIADHPLFDDRHEQDRIDWSKVTVPVLSAANWGGAGLHLRGNVEGFLRANTADKWLEVHGLEHWTHFYTDYGVGLQREFLDHFLKGEDNGWEKRPPVLVNVRHVDGSDARFEQRTAEAWPLPETSWQEVFLDAGRGSLEQRPVEASSSVTYDPIGDGVTFLTGAMATETEITGPLAVRLFISSATPDADLYTVLRVFDPSGDEVTFRGAMDAYSPVAQGWLRASHRELDEHESTAYRPVHTHTNPQPLVPGQVHEVEIEIWPTSVVVPAGYRLALTVRGKDYEYAGEISPEARAIHRYPSKGCGPFVHPRPEDLPADVFGGPVTIHTGAHHASRLLLPVIGSPAIGTAPRVAAVQS